jgi:hypothetical protein
MGRKQISIILPALLALGFALSMAACEGEVDYEGTSGIMEFENNGDTDIRETESVQAEDYTASDANPDNYSLVLKDNENYYYFLNKITYSDGRYYTGEVYYKNSSGYHFRGYASAVNRSNKALAIHYLDSRYNKMGLISIYWENDSGGAVIYYEPTGNAWSLTMTKYSGDF